ncbi:MAG: hypothetical protein K2Q10_07005, partial [Rhodospirillales bacterium]|nr:hypothetical protein [Rhodospirillales bacterium]
ALRTFAQAAGLNHPDAFLQVANHIFQFGRLPECYVTKADAQHLGWQPGSDLWKVAPGKAMGGDRFGNREKQLPFGQYVEADLDYSGGKRGAKRLIFARNSAGTWKQWVTVDHYVTFRPVPGN